MLKLNYIAKIIILFFILFSTSAIIVNATNEGEILSDISATHISDSFDVNVNDPDVIAITESYKKLLENDPYEKELVDAHLGENFSISPHYKVYVCDEFWEMNRYDRFYFPNSKDIVKSTLLNSTKIFYYLGFISETGTSYPFGFGLAYRHPATQKCYFLNGLYQNLYNFFSTANADIFSSVNATKNISDLEISETYFITDSHQRGIAYLVTNHGDYVYFSSFGTTGKLSYLFPVNEFFDVMDDIQSNRNYYSESTDFNDFSFFETQIISELAEFVVGGEEAIKTSYPDYKFLEEKTTAKTTEQPTQVQDSDYLPSAPTDKSDQDDLDVYKILFIAESAIVSCCLLCFVIYKLVKIKKKE